MSSSWFVRLGEKAFGPFTLSQMQEMLKNRKFTLDSLVRESSSHEWRPARKYAEIVSPNGDTKPGNSASPAAPPAGLPIVPPIPPTQRRNKTSSSFLVVASTACLLGAGLIAALIFLVARSSELVANSNSNPSEGTQNSLENTSVVRSVFGSGFTKKRGKSAEQIVRECEDSVALITTLVGSGTGFIIERNLIATNRHVVEHSLAEEIHVQFPSLSSEKLPVDLVYISPNIDFALLRSTKLPSKPLAYLPRYEFRRGQDIVVIGNPGTGAGTLQNAVSKGVMSSSMEIERNQYHQLSIAINPGNSGGPVFDDSGSVIGMVTLKATRQEGVAFSIPMDQVEREMAAFKKQSADERTLMLAFYRARSFYSFVNLALDAYLSANRIRVITIAETITQGGDINSGLVRASPLVESQIQKISSGEWELTKSLAKQVSSDPLLPQDVRDNLQAIWELAIEARTSAEVASGSLNSLSKELEAMTIKQRKFSDLIPVLINEMD